MSQLVTSRLEFAGVPTTLITAARLQVDPNQPRRVVAFGRLSRHTDQVAISDRLANANRTPAGR